MNELEQLTAVMIKDRKAITSSLNVAQVFHKQHTHVLRRIDQIKKDWDKAINDKTLDPKSSPVNQTALPLKMDAVLTNTLSPKMDAVKKRFKDHFKETTYITKDGRQVRSYDLDRFGFTMLVTSFNGKEAMKFKLAYFSRFDEMEQELIKRNTLYDIEKDLRRQLTDCLKEHYQGDKLSDEIRSMTQLLYMVTAGNNASKLKRDRGLDRKASVFAEALTSAERSKYMAKESQLIALYQAGVTDYHELKDKLKDTE
ncbi:Rha family transcriptional regulator [Ligilactobacillus murinus]|nr:Rha family transcriptional regulator [Ligilactobacillus murinus]